MRACAHSLYALVKRIAEARAMVAIEFLQIDTYYEHWPNEYTVWGMQFDVGMALADVPTALPSRTTYLLQPHRQFQGFGTIGHLSFFQSLNAPCACQQNGQLKLSQPSHNSNLFCPCFFFELFLNKWMQPKGARSGTQGNEGS
jgi:hypothetical protein